MQTHPHPIKLVSNSYITLQGENLNKDFMKAAFSLATLVALHLTPVQRVGGSVIVSDWDYRSLELVLKDGFSKPPNSGSLSGGNGCSVSAEHFFGS